MELLLREYSRIESFCSTNIFI
uniref:Uncharacterized protein n=1 Tax=Arundo donax TaxID=35708 RepID=A0A0A9HKJ2_ARUDO